MAQLTRVIWLLCATTLEFGNQVHPSSGTPGFRGASAERLQVGYVEDQNVASSRARRGDSDLALARRGGMRLRERERQKAFSQLSTNHTGSESRGRKGWMTCKLLSGSSWFLRRFFCSGSSMRKCRKVVRVLIDSCQVMTGAGGGSDSKSESSSDEENIITEMIRTIERNDVGEVVSAGLEGYPASVVQAFTFLCWWGVYNTLHGLDEPDNRDIPIPRQMGVLPKSSISGVEFPVSDPEFPSRAAAVNSLPEYLQEMMAVTKLPMSQSDDPSNTWDRLPVEHGAREWLLGWWRVVEKKPEDARWLVNERQRHSVMLREHGLEEPILSRRASPDSTNMYSSLEDSIFGRFLQHGATLQDPRWSDELDRHVFFGSIGQHRLSACRSSCPPAYGGETPYYVTKLSQYHAVPIRPGFAKYGADGFFSRDGRLLQIVAPGGEAFAPPGTGHLSTTQESWDYWKFVLRSTLLSLPVTAVDHLLLSHMLVSNHLVIATHEALPPDHPLRRLLTPFTYGTVEVNEKGAVSLLQERQILSRTTAIRDMPEFVKLGFADAAVPEKLDSLLPFSEPAWAALDPGLRGLPFYSDGREYYKVVERLVSGTFDLFTNGTKKRSQWCDPSTGAVLDKGLQGFGASLLRSAAALPEGHRLWGADLRSSCAALQRAVVAAIFMVTGWHRHVGEVLELIEDPAVASFSWLPGERRARPREALQATIIGVFTKRNYPAIGSQSFGYLGEECEEAEGASGSEGCDKQVYKLFEGVEEGKELTLLLDRYVGKDMEDLERLIDDANSKDCTPGTGDDKPVVCRKDLPFLAFHPQFMEMSIAV